MLGAYCFVENQQISHTPFNKVSSISEKIGADSYQLDITYGPDQQRWKSVLKKNNVLQKTTIFAGDYEIITENGVTRQLYYISGGDGLAAVLASLLLLEYPALLSAQAGIGYNISVQFFSSVVAFHL